MDHILAIDQGTTSTTAIVMDANGQVLGQASKEFAQHYPRPGNVEHLPQDIKNSIKDACNDALLKAGIKKNTIAGIGLTNQRETFSFFEPNGECATPFIVWQCRRSTEVCKLLAERFKNLGLKRKTGLNLDPYFSGTKILWLLQNEPQLKRRLQNKELLFGTVDTFLCHWLSGNQLHITDVTNASRTMLMDIKTCQYSEEALDLFAIPKECLPRIEKNLGPYGVTKNLDFLPDGIPIAAMAGDQQAALFGQGCFEAGEAKATFGTGSFILLNTGKSLSFSNHGLLSSVAYQIDDDPVYCLEGSAFVAGAAVQFLRDAMELIDAPQKVENLALSVKDNGGVMFIPALCGLGAPYWRPEMRGMLLGLERGTKKGHIARAVLEGIAWQNSEIIASMKKDATSPSVIKVDGTASTNNLLMQIQAELLGIKIIRPKGAQRTAMGAAYLAGLAIGLFEDTTTIKHLNSRADIFIPQAEKGWSKSLIKKYREIVK